jgi:hypothetical protein
MSAIPKDTQREVNAQLSKNVGKQLEVGARREFQKVKLSMLDEFESHPVTQELEAGPASGNTSGTLHGYGNLYTFIGFPNNYNPLGQVRLLLQATQLRKIQMNKRGGVEFVTTEPTRQQLFNITGFSDFRVEFEGARSWLDGIETGISGLGFYYFDLSRSFNTKRGAGHAIQLGGGKKTEKAFGGGSTGGSVGRQRSRYKRVSYISGILKNFAKRVYQLNRSLTVTY